MRALVVENSRLYRQLLGNILSQLGFTNDITDNLASAGDFLATEAYDLLLVNQFLEDGQGETLVKACNVDQRHRATPILFLSANRQLQPDDLAVRVSAVIHKLNLQQITDQITHFCEVHFDPVFLQGRILFVEDSRTMAVMIEQQLEKAGYRVDYFDNAEAAWAEFEAETHFGSHPDAYDLLLTDINLDGEMSGNELVDKVRQLEDGRGFVPIVAITGDNSDQLRIALYRAGVSDFLPKPVLQEELLVRINNLITNKRLLDKVHDIRRELYTLATTDKLTGCHNRHSLMEFSVKFISQAIRHRFPVGVMVIDLDKFKLINDNHGHAVGDLVLREVGTLLNETFREGDLVSRFGGEEFIALLSHCNGDAALAKAEAVRAEIEALKPSGLEISASIGVTAMEIGDKADLDRLFSAADTGAYEAKDNGRNQVVFKPLATVASQPGDEASNAARIGAG